MKKILKLLGLLVVILLIVLLIGRNFIAKTAVTGGVKAVAGLEMDIDSMDVGILNTLVGINEMKIYNPPEFSDRVMVDMPEIYIDYDLSAFIEGKVHLEELRINLKELTVVKDKDGKLNINSLKVAKTGKEKEPEKPGAKKETEIKIDLLDLKIGKVVYKDYSGGGEPKVLEYNLNLHEKYENITDLNELGKLILVKALMNTNIANLTNFALNSLQSEVSDTLKKATEAGKALQEIDEKITDILEETTQDIKDKLKLPFGK
jgi:hypothetical protein